MKMELIAALLFSPKVIFLDEPTIGLDVVSQKKVRDFIRFYNTQNKATILLTSHYMSDIEELCSRVIIIDHGKILYDGGLQGILERFADSKLITLMLENPVDSRDIESFGEIILNEGEKLILKIKRESVSRVSADLLNKLTVKDLTIEEPPIEDVIRDIFGNASRI
jgi:ABC-2 type transport system ATP-binding protein